MKYRRRSRISRRYIDRRARARKEFLPMIDNENSLYINEYSLYINRIYMLNALRKVKRNRRAQKAIHDWIRHYTHPLETLAPSLLQEYDRVFDRKSKRDDDGPEQNQFFDYAVKTLKEKTQQQPAPTPEETATRLIVQRFSLGPVAHALLTLRCFYDCDILTESLWNEFEDIHDHFTATATLLDRAHEEVEDAFRELADAGIIDLEGMRPAKRVDPSDYTHKYFSRVWHPPVRDMDELMARLVGQPCEATLHLSDFAYLEDRDEAVRLLRAAVQKRHKDISAPGVNILLVGRAPGKPNLPKPYRRWLAHPSFPSASRTEKITNISTTQPRPAPDAATPCTWLKPS